VYINGQGPFRLVLDTGANRSAVIHSLAARIGTLALEMVFTRESGTRVTPEEKNESRKRADISVFPLAFPFIAGPGAIAIVLLTFGAPRPLPLLAVGLFGVVILVLAITYALMRLTPTVMRVMGVTGAHVVSRLAGVVLAALAVQFIIDGLGVPFNSLRS
jgi:multiple antibiotic resistance protein